MRSIGRILLGILLLVGSVQAQSIRWGQIRTSETGIYNVKTSPFNAKGNGTTDDTTAIQAAITAASVSGGTVYFPPGTYKVSRLTIVKPKVYLKGAGIQTTILQTTVTTGSVVQFDSTVEAADIRGGGMEGFTIYGSIPNTVPVGTEIGLEILGDATSIWYEMDFSRLELRFLANGIKSSFQVDGRFSDITVDVVKKTTGIGIEVVNGHERWFNTVKAYNVAGDEGLAGIRIGAGSIGDYFDNISLLGSIKGVLINPGAEGVGTYANYAVWGQFSNLLVDSLTGCGVHIEPAAGKNVNTWMFQNTWASTVQNGVCTAGTGTISNIQFNGGRIRGASGHGFNLAAGSNIQIRNTNIEANIGYGIYASGVIGLDIQSNTIGLAAGDTQLYGVYLTSTTDGVNISGNSIRGNQMRWTVAATTLTSIVVSTNVATATTGAAHGLVPGSQVTISGATVDTSLNATYTVLTTPAPTTLTFTTSSVSDATYTESTLVMTTPTTIFDDTGKLDKWVGNNQGLDQGGQIVASADSITINPTSRISLSGTTTVKTMLAAPNWGNRKVYIQATDANPANPTLNVGGTAGSTFTKAVTLKQYEIAECVYSTTSSAWSCVSPHDPGADGVVTVRKGDDSGTCTLTFTKGLYTSTTCP